MPVAGGVALDVELPAPDARTRCQAVFADSTVAYTYDPGNRLTRISDTLGGTITRTYDSLDRLTGETTPQGAVSYGYDAAGRRTHLSVSGQPTASYAYDAAGRLTQLTQGTATVQFRYDAAHRRTGLSLPSGITATYTYDDASQLTGLTYQKDGTVLGDLHYTYDAVGNRTTISGTLARTRLPAAIPNASYDAAYRRTRVGTARRLPTTPKATCSPTAPPHTYTHLGCQKPPHPQIAPARGQCQLPVRRLRTAHPEDRRRGNSTNYLYDGLNPRCRH